MRPQSDSESQRGSQAMYLWRGVGRPLWLRFPSDMLWDAPEAYMGVSGGSITCLLLNGHRNEEWPNRVCTEVHSATMSMKMWCISKHRLVCTKSIICIQTGKQKGCQMQQHSVCFSTMKITKCQYVWLSVLIFANYNCPCFPAWMRYIIYIHIFIQNHHMTLLMVAV